MPTELVLKNVPVRVGSKINVLGNDTKLSWKTDGSNTIIKIPAKLNGSELTKHVVVFRIKSK